MNQVQQRHRAQQELQLLSLKLELPRPAAVEVDHELPIKCPLSLPCENPAGNLVILLFLFETQRGRELEAAATINICPFTLATKTTHTSLCS